MEISGLETFECKNCAKTVDSTNLTGTKQRNHCPHCLWSLHVDLDVPGDRKSTCRGLMKPIGLSYREEGFDKYGNKKQGELMVVHQCESCGKVSINRMAADDDSAKILELVNTQAKITNINLLTAKDLPEVKTQLFGNLHFH